MSNVEVSAESEVCRPCPLSKLGCGPAESPDESQGETHHGFAALSPGTMSLIFLLPLAAAIVGVVLADGLMGPRPIAQLLGGLTGLTGGGLLAGLARRRCGDLREDRS